MATKEFEELKGKEVYNIFIQSGVHNAIYKTLAKRLERKKIYGDGFKNDAAWEILAEIKQKTKRLEQFIINNRDEKLYENRVDTLVDLTIYSLFLLENTLRDTLNKKIDEYK